MAILAILDRAWVLETILLAPWLLLSLTVHEFAHARTALAFGDPTAKYMGRVSLNPLRHLDPIGTIVLFVTHFFGWAKPVPVNPANLHPPRLGDIAVTAAGPLSNLALAIVTGLLLKIVLLAGPQALGKSLHSTAAVMLQTAMVINVALCVFNLIPLFPLDGHHILRELLPDGMREGFMRWQLRFGAIALLALIIGPRLLETLSRGRYTFEPLLVLLRPVLRALMALLGLV